MTVHLTLISGKAMEQPILETLTRHVTDKVVIRSSQHGSTKGISCLANLITFYNEIYSLIDEGQAVSGKAALQKATWVDTKLNITQQSGKKG